MIARPAGVCNNLGSGFGWPWSCSPREALVWSGIRVIICQYSLLKSTSSSSSFFGPRICFVVVKHGQVYSQKVCMLSLKYIGDPLWVGILIDT